MVLQSAKHLCLLLKLGNQGTRGFSWSLPFKEKYTNNIRFVFLIDYVIEHVMSLKAFAAKKKNRKEKKICTILEGLFFFFQATVRLTSILEHVVASPLKKRSVCSTLSPDVTGTARTSEGGVRLQ